MRTAHWVLLAEAGRALNTENRAVQAADQCKMGQWSPERKFIKEHISIYGINIVKMAKFCGKTDSFSPENREILRLKFKTITQSFFFSFQISM